MLRKKLQDERAAGVTEGEGIVATATTEDRELTAEEMTRLSALKARREAIDAQLAVIEEQRTAEKTQAAIGTTAAATTATPIANIQRVHDNREDKPWGADSGAPFGEFLLAVKNAKTGGYQDPRLFRAATGASEQIDSDGGYLVGTDMVNDLTTRINSGALLSRVKRYPLRAGSNGLDIKVVDETSRATGSRWGAVRGYWVAEGGSITASRPKLASVELKLKKVAALGYDTGELEDDAPAYAALMTDAFEEELRFLAEDGIYNGDGAGKPLGFLNAPALVTVAKETGQSAATIVSANLSKMWARFSGRDPVWFINRDVNPQLDELSIPAGTGALEPRFVTYGSDGIMRIKGAPVVEVEYAATLGTVGDIVLADMSAYAYIDGGGVKTAQSIHVAFTTDEMAFRATMRCDGQVLPRSALTPFKGTGNTRSPFVALATRA